MKFILGNDGTLAINSEFVKTLYIEQEDGAVVSVIAECVEYPDEKGNPIYDYHATLATFDGKDADENFSAASKYLAGLVDKLNGGSNK